ncbi:MAG: hypothetical protein HPY65_18990 [Syntrophaceae bacterium]|nr:hypothetical protein [Syntrophaceae bacterium]
MIGQDNSLESELKRILEERIIKEEPHVGAYSWICIVKSTPFDRGNIYYKIGHTGRLEAYLKMIKKDPHISNDTPPLVLKIWGGASQFIKVVRRIFKDKRMNLPPDGKVWFALSDDDISWLSKFTIAKSNNIESAIYALFDKQEHYLTNRLKKEGLW